DPATGMRRSVDAAVDRLHAVREVAGEFGVPLVVNARTDVFLEMSGSPDDLLAEALTRLAAYRDAGADCLFPIGLRDPGSIRRLAAELRHPVNILAGPGLPSVAELGELGVARVSLGGGAQRTALA